MQIFHRRIIEVLLPTVLALSCCLESSADDSYAYIDLQVIHNAFPRSSCGGSLRDGVLAAVNSTLVRLDEKVRSVKIARAGTKKSNLEADATLVNLENSRTALREALGAYEAAALLREHISLVDAVSEVCAQRQIDFVVSGQSVYFDHAGLFRNGTNISEGVIRALAHGPASAGALAAAALANQSSIPGEHLRRRFAFEINVLPQWNSIFLKTKGVRQTIQSSKDDEVREVLKNLLGYTTGSLKAIAVRYNYFESAALKAQLDEQLRLLDSAPQADVAR